MTLAAWQEKLMRTDPAYIVKVGRIPYKVEFDAIKNVQDNESYPVNAEPAPLEEANCWSSVSKLIPDLHLPVFDVDVDKDARCDGPIGPLGYPAFFTGTVQEATETIIQKTYRDQGLSYPPISWVPSTTPKHYHVYVDGPIEWLYFHRLLTELVQHKIVEWGYLSAAEARKLTCVRMPHVKRPPRVRRDDYGDIPTDEELESWPIL